MKNFFMTLSVLLVSLLQIQRLFFSSCGAHCLLMFLFVHHQYMWRVLLCIFELLSWSYKIWYYKTIEGHYSVIHVLYLFSLELLLLIFVMPVSQLSLSLSCMCQFFFFAYLSSPSDVMGLEWGELIPVLRSSGVFVQMAYLPWST